MQRLRTPDGAVDVAVDHARDGVEALARLQLRPRVDLVIADLYMPVMDGFTLVERLRADPDVMTTPVLAISAGGEEARARAMDLGVDVYLPKPVKFSEIVGTVRALLRMA
jgi:CheY-like chemotaxis protein